MFLNYVYFSSLSSQSSLALNHYVTQIFKSYHERQFYFTQFDFRCPGCWLMLIRVVKGVYFKEQKHQIDLPMEIQSHIL